ncbi:hypothetical protein J4E80_003185 [Alternaria sp. BMP 0032]|nr:hypothetical protein J4E80_003185 [Alternaria sp. BMP 0032]
MASFQDIPIENLTLEHKKSRLILDGLIDRMSPISALTDPLPKDRVCGSLGIFPTEILLQIIEDLTIRDTMRFRRCCRFAMHLVDTESPLRFWVKAEEKMYDWEYVDEVFPHQPELRSDRYNTYWINRRIFLGEMKAQQRFSYLGHLTDVDVVPKMTVMAEKEFYCLCCLGTAIRREVFTREEFLVHLRDVCRVRPKGIWYRNDLPELVLASD